MTQTHTGEPYDEEPGTEPGLETGLETGTIEPLETHDPLEVAVRHDVRAPVAVALVSAVLAVGWFSRALTTGAVLDWLWCAVPAAVGLLMLAVLRDARAPLLVADEHGVRVRHRDTWNGVRWLDVDRLEVRGGSRLRDGELVVHPDGDHETGAFSVPIGWGTRVVHDGLTGDLADDLDSLSAGQAPVVVLRRTVPEADAEADADADAADLRAKADADAPQQETEERRALRDPAGAASGVGVSEHVEVVSLSRHGGEGVSATLPEQREPRETVGEVESVSDATDLPPADHVELLSTDRAPRIATRAEVVRETSRRLSQAQTIPAQREGAGEPVVVARVDDLGQAPVPVADPVIGPVVAAARHRARLSIDTLSERTRIRPHVLECIEVDDFESCGGDFYARGHLRTLARVFGLDPEELVRSYDERYARPEIEARQVFEAELATGIGGGLRTATTGPRWSMLAAAVLVLVTVWGTTRVFSETPEELVSPSPQISDTVDLAGGDGESEPAQPESALGAITVETEGDASQVVVRDASGRILWVGRLGEGQQQRVIGPAPFDITASNGAAVRVTYLGRDRGTVGSDATADNRRFG